MSNINLGRKLEHDGTKVFDLLIADEKPMATFFPFTIKNNKIKNQNMR